VGIGFLCLFFLAKQVLNVLGRLLVSGHAVGLCTAKNGVPYTYYFGSAWSKYDCQSFDEWNTRIEKFMASQENPLNVKIQ